MINKEAIKIIEGNPITIATADKEGKPRATNVAYVKVRDNKLLITNNYMNQTIQNLKQNPQISIAVFNDKWKGYQIEGTAKYSESGPFYDFVKSMKENENEPCKGVIIVEVKTIKETG